MASFQAHPLGQAMSDVTYPCSRPLRVEGGILRPRVEKLLVRGSDKTALVEGVLKLSAPVEGLAARLRCRKR